MLCPRPSQWRECACTYTPIFISINRNRLIPPLPVHYRKIHSSFLSIFVISSSTVRNWLPFSLIYLLTGSILLFITNLPSPLLPPPLLDHLPHSTHGDIPGSGGPSSIENTPYQGTSLCGYPSHPNSNMIAFTACTSMTTHILYSVLLKIHDLFCF